VEIDAEHVWEWKLSQFIGQTYAPVSICSFNLLAASAPKIMLVDRTRTSGTLALAHDNNF
jgi:hypothetical protein